MREGRLEEIKARLEGHDSGAYHDASDMAIGFGEVVSESLELIEVVERVTALLDRKRETMKLFGPAIEQAKQKRDHMLVAKIEIEKFKAQTELDLLENLLEEP